MKIAYLSNYSPLDVSRWSGTPCNVFRALSKIHEVIWIGKNIVDGLRWHHILMGSKENFFPENYIEEEGRYLSSIINAGGYDIVITSTYHFCAKLDVEIPIIFYGDLTYDIYKTYFRSQGIKYDRLASYTENLSLKRIDAIIYPSAWIARHAIRTYGIDWRKVHVVEFGANIETPPVLTMPNEDICNIVFVGRSWKHKGGDVAYGAYCNLKHNGFACRLTIVGATPPFSITDPDVTVYPWLDKSNSKDVCVYNRILQESHFLLLPTKFDAFGIALCEANAYGTPCISTLVGGVGQVIKDGVNGYLLYPSSRPEEYGKKIQEVFNDKEMYHKLRLTSRKEYEKRLNWGVWVNQVTNIATKILNSKLKCSNVKNARHIPTYIINLPERTDRRLHMEQQFMGKSEFDIEFVNAERHNIGAVGLWASICKIVSIAQEREEDVIIVCEDDHTFTKNYSAETLLRHIHEAAQQGAELLTFGVGNFDTAIPVSRNRYWVKSFLATQFIVLYKPIFAKILKYDFKNNDAADRVLPLLSNCNMLVYPFMSYQHDFGYSDVTPIHNEKPGIVTRCFARSDLRMSEIHFINNRYNLYDNQ